MRPLHHKQGGSQITKILTKLGLNVPFRSPNLSNLSVTGTTMFPSINLVLRKYKEGIYMIDPSSPVVPWSPILLLNTNNFFSENVMLQLWRGYWNWGKHKTKEEASFFCGGSFFLLRGSNALASLLTVCLLPLCPQSVATNSNQKNIYGYCTVRFSHCPD